MRPPAAPSRRMPVARLGVRPPVSCPSRGVAPPWPFAERGPGFPVLGGGMRRTRTTLAAAAVLAATTLLGWLTASGRPTTTLAQDRPGVADPLPSWNDGP